MTKRTPMLHPHRVPAHFRQRDILTVAQELGINAKPASGPWYDAICPMHDDHDPSLRINSLGQYWWCHGCNCGGDALELVYRVRRLHDSDFTRYQAYLVVVDATSVLDDLSAALSASADTPVHDVGAVLLATRLRALRGTSDFETIASSLVKGR